MLNYDWTIKVLKSNLQILYNSIGQKIFKYETFSERWEKRLKLERWRWEQVAKARKEWFQNIEPKHRYSSGYPRDWHWRRVEVYRRAGAKCESCGISVGHVEVVPIWGHNPHFVEKLVGAHVHHRVKVSEGGSHAFSNLELLCKSCHIKKHPERDHFF